MNENLAVTSESLNYTELFVTGSGFPVVIDSVTVAAGENLTRGTVVGLLTTGGKAKKSDSAATDGSQEPYAVLASDAAAASADVVVPVYLTGEFNAAALTFGGTDTADTRKAALRNIGIFVKTVA